MEERSIYPVVGPDNLPAFQADIRQRIWFLTDALLNSKPFMHTWAFLSLRKRKITTQDQVGDPRAWTMKGITHESIFRVVGVKQDA